MKEEGNHNEKLLSVEAKIFIAQTDGEALRLGSEIEYMYGTPCKITLYISCRLKFADQEYRP